MDPGERYADSFARGMIRDEVEHEVEVGDKVVESPELGEDSTHGNKSC
jgi:hypothetical protein